jgi:hypothetical protein
VGLDLVANLIAILPLDLRRVVRQVRLDSFVPDDG